MGLIRTQRRTQTHSLDRPAQRWVARQPRWRRYETPRALALAGGLSVLASCGARSGDHTETRSSDRAGRLRLALQTSLEGVPYQLSASFLASGPELRAFETTAEAPEATVLTQELQTGTYSVQLEPGYQLLDVSGPTAQPVAATLLSSNPQTVEVAAEQTTQLVLSFAVAGNQVQFDTGSLQVSFEVSNVLPSNLDASLATTLDRRGGDVELSWVAAAGASGEALSQYFVRCSEQAIVSEAIWASAQSLSVDLVPGTAGTNETLTLGGFAPLTPRYCAVRGRDDSGLLTGLGQSALVDLDFESVDFAVAAPNPGAFGAAYPRQGVAAVGDVNGDGAADYVYAAVNSEAQLFFGRTSPGLPTTTPAVSLTRDQSNDMFGASVVGLGDINADGLSDFAIAAAATEYENPGQVFVFFGRTNWPSSVDLEGGCFADLCLGGAGDESVFGSALSGGDFDGDGQGDLVIGAAFSNNYVGRVYALRGGLSGGLPTTPVTTLGSDPGSSIAMTDPNLTGFVINPPAGSETYYFGTSLTMPTLGRTLVVGAPDDLGVSRVLAIEGRSYSGTGLSPIDQAADFSEILSGAPTAYGRTLRAGGDVNGDGFLDLLASYNASVGGRVEILLGSGTGYSMASRVTYENTQLAIGRFFGLFVGDGFNRAFASGGSANLHLLSNLDSDAAGTSDVLVGAIGQSGDAHIVLSRLPLSGLTAPTGFSRSFESVTGQAMVPNFVGDVTGDGHPDFAIVDLDNWNTSTAEQDSDPVEARLHIVY